jgi:hypothetical protein
MVVQIPDQVVVQIRVQVVIRMPRKELKNRLIAFYLAKGDAGQPAKVNAGVPVKTLVF